MKIQQAFAFAPHRWASPDNTLHSPEEDKARLRAEHPGLARGLEVAQVGTTVALAYLPAGPLQKGVGALTGAVALGTAAWGVDKLIQGETCLDYLEGVGSLAFAADSAISSYTALGGNSKSLVALQNPLGAIYAASDLAVGGSDLIRGLREKDTRRALEGGFQVAMGASMMAAVFLPAAGHVANAVWVASLVGRELTLEV